MTRAAAPIVTGLVDGPLAATRWTPALTPGRGAVASFLGVVRDHAKGRGVTRLHYECYRPMAEKVLHRIADEARRFDPALAVTAWHGLGTMVPGEVSLVLHAASAHRGPAFDAVRWLLEEIKRELPVWKRQTFDDGSDEWVHGS